MANLEIPSESDIRKIFIEEFGKFTPIIFPDEDFCMDKKQTAKYIGGSQSTVDNLRRAGILKAIYLSDGKTRGKPVFLKSEVRVAIKSLQLK